MSVFSARANEKIVRRETFDPVRKDHILSLSAFLSTGSWGDVHFFIESPYIDVPSTVLQKYAKFKLAESCQNT